ncbi:MAG TPA: amidohydrolase family protein [Thermoanaerobaculia bacterium]|nr:amidohydrolase family protein [Thermoanaerobaculia bacterium]
MKIFLLALTLTLAACTHSRPADLALTHASVINVETGAIRRDRTILIAGDRVIETSGARPRAARVVDVGGRYVMPGLCDMHVHTLWDPAVRSTFLPLLVANGITSVRDMGGTLEVTNAVRAEIANGTLIGPRITASGPVLDGPEPVDPSISIPVATVDEARAAVQKLARANVDFIKVYTLLPRDAFFAVMDEARKAGLTVAGHVPADVTAAEASNAGMTSIEHMRSEIALFCSRDKPADCEELLRLFLKNGTWQTPTLAVRRARAYIEDPAKANDSRLRYLPKELRAIWLKNRASKLTRPPAYFAEIKKQHENEIWLAGVLHRHGVPLLAGSDAGADFSYPGDTLHEELELLVSAGLTPLQALQAATTAPARYLGRTGNEADLLILDANPLDDIRNTRSIRGVVLAGRYLDRAALDALIAGAAEAAR